MTAFLSRMKNLVKIGNVDAIAHEPSVHRHMHRLDRQTDRQTDKQTEKLISGYLQCIG